jgi:5'-deoxynucleotidase YfbR-like HD superfamily hydrolase
MPDVRIPLKRRETAPRAWQRMLSGRRLDLLDPSPLDVEIGDVAHGLARVARWNGQTHGANIFSVAQHSLLVEDIAGRLAPAAPPALRLIVLLHDAPEYVIGDMISPFKVVLGGEYRAVEDRLMRAIHLRFGLPPERDAAATKLLKRADRCAAFLEATRLAGFSVEEARSLFGRPEGAPATLDLTPWPADLAAQRFLDRFAELSQ